MDNFRVLVTGAQGFIGRALCEAMDKTGLPYVPVVRSGAAASAGAIVTDIGPGTDWRPDIGTVGAVVHLAARVHVMNDTASDALREYRHANVDATLNLARQCAEAGVKRFVSLSSVKVNGETTRDRPFSSMDQPHPSDPYAVSKLEAEQGLARLAQQTGLEVVIIRPPLVYGPGVKANFLELMKWVRRGVPLPLARVVNLRSMVYVDNLVDLILCCLRHEQAPGRTFLVSDGHDVSTPELITAVSSAMGQASRLIPVPPGVLLGAAALLGKRAAAERLLGSLQVDIGATRQALGWTPPHAFEAGIEKTVRHFLRQEAGAATAGGER